MGSFSKQTNSLNSTQYIVSNKKKLQINMKHCHSMLLLLL